MSIWALCFWYSFNQKSTCLRTINTINPKLASLSGEGGDRFHIHLGALFLVLFWAHHVALPDARLFQVPPRDRRGY